MTTQYRSTAINVWSSDKSSTLFKVIPANTVTTITNANKDLDIHAPVRVFDSDSNLVNPITYSESLVKDSSGNTISMDNIQTLLADALDASGNLISDHAQVATNTTNIASHSTEIADLLARIVVLENQMSELSNP